MGALRTRLRGGPGPASGRGRPAGGRGVASRGRLSSESCWTNKRLGGRQVHFVLEDGSAEVQCSSRRASTRSGFRTSGSCPSAAMQKMIGARFGVARPRGRFRGFALLARVRGADGVLVEGRGGGRGESCPPRAPAATARVVWRRRRVLRGRRRRGRRGLDVERRRRQPQQARDGGPSQPPFVSTAACTSRVATRRSMARSSESVDRHAWGRALKTVLRHGGGGASFGFGFFFWTVWGAFLTLIMRRGAFRTAAAVFADRNDVERRHLRGEDVRAELGGVHRKVGGQLDDWKRCLGGARRGALRRVDGARPPSLARASRPWYDVTGVSLVSACARRWRQPKTCWQGGS